MNDQKRYDVIIIGGGFAGLIAARDLGEMGRNVLLLEARDRLGGRAHSQVFPGTDKVVELGGTWVMPHYMPEIGRELKRYGWELTGSEAGALEFRWQFGNADKASFPIAPDDRYALERALFQIGCDARRIDTTRPRDQQDLADLDISVADYLDRMDLPGSVYDLLAAFARIGAGAAVGDWSALMALSLVAAYDNSPYAWFASVTTRFRDGTGAAIKALSSHAGEIRLNAVVKSIVQTAENVTITIEGGDSFCATSAILAVPVPLWKSIDFSPQLMAEKRDAAVRGHAGRMGKLWVLAEGLQEGFSSFGAHTDLLLLQTEYRLGDKSLLVGFVSPPSTLDINDIDAVTQAVRHHAPEAKVISIFGHDWSTDTFAQGSWMVNPVGQLSAYASKLQKSEGRVFFAGTDIATRWIGWIDGAVETGRVAAEQADDFCRREQSL
ncbi:MAG: NAD(P)/FAD-dependent oxidoreductase [Pseudomonadota bacterium]